MGHFKALSGFSDIFPPTHRILDKFGTHGKSFTRRVQRRTLQEVWSRTRRGRRIIPELLHPDILTDIGAFLIGNLRSNCLILNVGSPPLVPRRFQGYLGWLWGRKASLIRGESRGSCFCLLVLTCKVGYCMAAAVDVDLASGASNIYSLIAGSFIIWQGTCIFYIESYFSDLRSPLLSFECGFFASFLQCNNLLLIVLR